MIDEAWRELWGHPLGALIIALMTANLLLQVAVILQLCRDNFGGPGGPGRRCVDRFQQSAARYLRLGVATGGRIHVSR